MREVSDAPGSNVFQLRPSTKAATRKNARAKRAKLTTNKVVFAPQVYRLARKLGRRRATGAPLRVASYASYGNEPYTDHLNAELLTAGHAILLPRMIEDGLAWVDMSIDAEPEFAVNSYGIREPQGPDAGLAGVHIVLVPALAVTRAGDRLGQGGGFYDRALARCHASPIAGRCSLRWCTRTRCSRSPPGRPNPTTSRWTRSSPSSEWTLWEAHPQDDNRAPSARPALTASRPAMIDRTTFVTETEHHLHYLHTTRAPPEYHPSTTRDTRVPPEHHPSTTRAPPEYHSQDDANLRLGPGPAQVSVVLRVGLPGNQSCPVTRVAQ